MNLERHELQPEIPQITGNLRVSRPQLETCAYVAPVAPATPANPLPLFSFVTADGALKSLRKPIMLRVSVEDGDVFVENDSLNIFGNGRTLQAAVEAFSRDLAYFWNYYRSLAQNEVAGEGSALKRLYEEIVA